MPTKSVFISYSHDNEKYKEWLRNLAEDLIYNGIEVFLDQWHLQIGEDLSLFKNLRKNQFQHLGRPFKYSVDSLISLLNEQFK